LGAAAVYSVGAALAVSDAGLCAEVGNVDGVGKIVFRASVRLRVLSALGSVVLLLFSISGAKSSEALTAAQKVITPVITGLFSAALVYLAAFRPRLVVSRETVIVVAPVGRREVPASEVVKVEGGMRMVITLRTGERVAVWAVQNSRLTELRGVWGPADEAAARVAEFLDLGSRTT